MFPASQLVQLRGELERNDMSSDSEDVFHEREIEIRYTYIYIYIYIYIEREREREREREKERERDARNFSRNIRKKSREKFLFKNVENIRLSSCSCFSGPRKFRFHFGFAP